MRLLDRLIRGVLTISVILLGGYILVRTVTIAGENGMFQDSPVLSALYRKLETAGMQIYIPVISYQEDVLEASPEQDLADSIGRSLYPAGFWAEREQKQEGREEEYELILAAEARAEEEKKPLDLKQWMEERTEGDQEAEFETLLNRYFSMDAATTIDSSRLNNSLLDLDLTLDTEKEGPQILIYHSHSQEGFVDTVEGDDTTTIVGVGDYGRPTANLMFILGMSRTADQQDISYLPNPYIKENMAFALQIQERAEIAAPGLMRNIYLMAYRFNLHYRPRSMLLEAGTQLNTLEEEKNAMEVFAGILDAELKGR